MPTAEELEAQAKALAHDDVVRLLDCLISCQPTPDWEPGKALEYLFLQAFQLEGADVTWPYNVVYPQKVGVVEQIDGVIHLDGVSFLVECKDEATPVAVEPLAKLRMRLQQRPPGLMGLLVSTSDFTRAASLFAQFSSPLDVLLWGKSDLEFAIRNQKMGDGLLEKYRWAVLRGLPDLQLGVEA